MCKNLNRDSSFSIKKRPFRLIIRANYSTHMFLYLCWGELHCLRTTPDDPASSYDVAVNDLVRMVVF